MILHLNGNGILNVKNVKLDKYLTQATIFEIQKTYTTAARIYSPVMGISLPVSSFAGVMSNNLRMVAAAIKSVLCAR